MTDRIKALEDALEWYAEQARLARLIHKEGDAGRHALATDGGTRARAALAASQTAQPVAGNTVQDAALWQEVALKIWRIANSTDPEDPEFIDALRAIAEGRA